VSLYVFFNPELVQRLTACGIASRAARAARAARAQASGTPPQGFVLEGHPTRVQVPRTATHRIGTYGSVTITEPRLLPGGLLPGGLLPGERPEIARTDTSPQTALELVVECERLRQDNQRLTAEASRLRAEVDRLSTRPGSEVARLITGPEQDDTSRRFALLELD
jgi:hypothetical protein